MKNEINLSYNYRKSLITTLSGLSNFYANKPFSEITREELQEYLNSLRKPEPIDPFHKCIGTYNYYLSSISKFFKG